MTIKCAWASQDERGKASGGRAGDQTGREVKIGDWYAFGQTEVLRFKNRTLAKKHAACMKYLASIEPDGDADGDMDGCVGYDQADRLSLYNELKRLGYDYKKLRTKVETDCSAMTAASLNCIGIKVEPTLYTGNMSKILMDTGKFVKLTEKKYLTGFEALQTGDIILNPSTHVITVLEDGPFATASNKKPAKKSGYTVGQRYSLQRNMNVRTGPGTAYRRLKRIQLTADGRKHALNKTYAVLKKGTTVTCLEVKTTAAGTWIRIPSGWICAKGKSTTYVE